MIPEHGEARREFVVVPRSPGPLIPLDGDHGHRGRDDLDVLIDDLFPEVDDGAGWFDVALLVLGVVLLGWAVLGRGPGFVAVVGGMSLGLGCILPLRSAWRRAKRRRGRRQREALLARGVLVDAASPSTSRLVRAYDDLLGLEGVDDGSVDDMGPPAIAAAHGALLEAATLLEGRAPDSEREASYVEKRAVAIEALAVALRESRRPSSPSSGDTPGLEPGALVEAREELDQIAGFNSISRLEELTEEMRIRRHGEA